MGKDIFCRYLKNEKRYIILLICIIGMGVGINGINPYIYGNIIDSITEIQRKEFEKWVIVFLVVLLLVQILEAVESIIGNFLVNHIENKMQESLMKKILFLKCEEVDKYTEGKLLNRLEFDAEKIVGYYSDLLTSILMVALNLSISLFFILHISQKLSTIALAVIPLLYFINLVFREKIRKVSERTKRFEDKYFGFISDVFFNLKSIKIFREEKNIYEKYFGYLKKRLNLQIKNTCLINIIGMLRGMLGNVINIVILLIAGVAIISGQMTIGNMVAFNTYLGSFFESIFKVMELNLDRQSVLISYKRMLELENQEEEDYNAGIELGFIENIICKNLNFGYEQEMILKELNITISGNGLYSIVGNNGCGKTTFLKLLERFYDKVSGEIFINNIEIEKYALSSLRKSIFYMAKEPFFMQDTILNNLRMGKDTVLKQEIIELCQKVGIHDEIMYLPEGYETVMEKGGENFSSGQKQKLGFVRVLLSQASLILLDEVTSDMDGIAEKKMCDLVEEMSQYSIVINVSHKPESLKRSKKIFLIENGKIVGSGLHCEMLRGYEQYRKMFGV